MALTPREAQLWVRGRAMVVARSLLELSVTPPREWTVVPAAGRFDSYLVCPGCRHRVDLLDRQATTLRCPRCNELFTIAWEDGSGEPAFRATTPPSRDELRPDRRMTRRRIPRDRRSGHERRDGDRRSVYAVSSMPSERRLAERRVMLSRRIAWERRAVPERRRRATNW